MQLLSVLTTIVPIILSQLPLTWSNVLFRTLPPPDNSDVLSYCLDVDNDIIFAECTWTEDSQGILPRVDIQEPNGRSESLLPTNSDLEKYCIGERSFTNKTLNFPITPCEAINGIIMSCTINGDNSNRITFYIRNCNASTVTPSLSSATVAPHSTSSLSSTTEIFTSSSVVSPTSTPPPTSLPTPPLQPPLLAAIILVSLIVPMICILSIVIGVCAWQHRGPSGDYEVRANDEPQHRNPHDLKYPETEESDRLEVSSLSNDVIPSWAKKMADNWFNFGIALGFSEEDLQSIKDLNDTGGSDSDEVCCSVMLYQWLRTGDQREKTYWKLLQAAKEATHLVVPSRRVS